MIPSLLLVLLLPGCGLLGAPEYRGYYDPADEPPEVDAIEPSSERGNVGGTEVRILGRGFGEDVSDLVVQFGDRNADILEVTDDQLRVRAPAGPMSGGGVRVRVGTSGGYADAEDSYTYDVVFDDSFPLDEQVGYIRVNNYWRSCYGGLGSDFNGCETFAYIGYAGVDGAAQALGFPYPRLEAPSIGFVGAGDLGSEGWTVTRNYQYPFAVGIEDLYIDPGPVTLTNLTLAAVDADEDPYCADLDGLATYWYGGGEAGQDVGDPSSEAASVTGDGLVTGLDRSEYEEDIDMEDPKSKSSAAKEATEDENQAEKAAAAGTTVDEMFPCEAYPWEPSCVEYARHDLQFCQRDDELGVPTLDYRADWPIARDFFSDGNDEEVLPVTVRVRAEDIGLDAELPLPPPLELSAKQGFGSETGKNEWSVSAMDACFAKSGREESLDDVAIRFQWQSAGSDFTPELAVGGISGSRTYVRVTLTYFSFGWFSVTGYPVRATIAVPDDYGAEGDGVSTLDIPSEVLYQFPSIRYPQGGQTQFGTTYETYAPNLGFLVLTADRITEYLVDSDAGPIVFSYATGDFGFYEWSNPTDGSCHDCADGDQDGWTDAADPDCARDGAGAELGFGTTACNDGIDNDGDGTTDGEDGQCADAEDDDESNCDDGRDNDDDGFADADDPECAAGGSELVPDNCEDGLDNDEDGWTDAEDPGCSRGDGESGTTNFDCNDGRDNDDDGLVDRDDPECADATDNDEAE